jgi:hypothetical protein
MHARIEAGRSDAPDLVGVADARIVRVVELQIECHQVLVALVVRRALDVRDLSAIDRELDREGGGGVV